MLVENINRMNSSSQVCGTLLHFLLFAGLIVTTGIKVNPVRNVSYVFVQLPIRTVAVVGARFFGLRSSSIIRATALVGTRRGPLVGPTNLCVHKMRHCDPQLV